MSSQEPKGSPDPGLQQPPSTTNIQHLAITLIPVMADKQDFQGLVPGLMMGLALYHTSEGETCRRGTTVQAGGQDSAQ